MADTYTKEELIEIYRGLPPQVKDAIFSPETTDIFDAIKEKQGLTDEQREIMSVYTGFLMMGVLPPEKYVSTLIEKMGIDREKVASIAQTINRDLFNPIKDVLKEVHAMQKNDATQTPVEEKVAPISTPATVVAAPQSAPVVSTMPQAVASPIVPPPVAATPTPTTQGVQAGVSTNDSAGGATQPHIGSIFEQKLGGEFRLKSDAVVYSDQAGGQSTPGAASTSV